MYRFAVIKSGVVDNVVVSDFEQSEVLLMGMIPGAEEVIRITDDTKDAYIGYPFINGKFMPVPTFNSWVFNEESWQYEPPVAMPTDSPYYFWNESIVNWEKFLPEDIAALEAAEA